MGRCVFVSFKCPHLTSVFSSCQKESGAHLLNSWVECGDHEILSLGRVVCISACGVVKTCPGGIHGRLSSLPSLPPAVLMLLLPDCLSQDPDLVSDPWWCSLHSEIVSLSLYYQKSVPLDQKLLTQMPTGAREMMWVMERCCETDRDGIECSEVRGTYPIWGHLPLASFPTIRTWPRGC